MNVSRMVFGAVLLAGLACATPASAQFYFKSKDLRGAPIKGDEPGLLQPLPGATDPELRAGLVWSMRSALNVAALQCQFEPTLLTVDNYNAILGDHKDELKKSYDTLLKYFTRINKTKAAGQSAFDQYGGRTYSSFTAIAGQYSFCQTASSIGRDMIFAQRGGFGDVASRRMRELRNSLIPWGEQQFRRDSGADARMFLPQLDPLCWTKKDEWNVKKCGPTVQWVRL